MSIKSLYGIVAACAAGYIGGLLSPQRAVNASQPEVVRASRFELINTSGIPVANWEVGSSGEARMRFLDRRDVVGVEIGVLADGRPWLRMAGRDGITRIEMKLDLADKPMLGMGDDRWQGRVHLGFMPPDAFPYSNWDHWGMLFRAPGSEHSVVGMGTTNTRNNPAAPFLTIGGKSIE